MGRSAGAPHLVRVEFRRWAGSHRTARAGRQHIPVRLGGTSAPRNCADRCDRVSEYPEQHPRAVRQAGRILITRERTTTRTQTEIIDCSAIRPFAFLVSGSVSVGLKATTLVNAR